MTNDEYSRCLALIDGYWPHGTKDWTADTLEIWKSLLLDLDTIHVAAAIQAIADDGDRWPPPPGLIRRRTLELSNPQATADEAWAEVTGWVAKIGTRRHTMDFATGETCEPVWSDPLIGRIADSIGWDELCASENVMADRAHFLKFYAEAVARRRTLDHLPAPARAALEAHNIAMPDLSATRELTR